jgi:hypothetical protein
VDARARARRRLDGRGEGGPGGGLDQVSMIITPFMGRGWPPGRRGAMPPGFPGHRSSVATTPEAKFAPPKAALKGRLACPFGRHGAACLWCPTPGRETAPGANAWRCFRRRSTASNP